LRGTLLVGLFAVLFASAILTAGEPAKYEEIRGVNTGLPPSELTWVQATDHSEEQHIFMIGFFEGGIHTFTTLFTFKYGPFQKWGFYTLLQDDNSNKTIFVKAECPEKGTSVSYTSYDFKCGDTSYSGKWPDFTLKVRDPELQADIKFHTLAPPFTPGKFFLTPDKSVFTKTTVFSPRAKTEASLSFSGKSLKLKGEGYADHTRQNIPFTRQGPVYYAVRGFPNFTDAPPDQFYLNFSLQEMHKGYGGGFEAFAHIVRDKKIIAVTRNLTVEPLQQVTDPDSGYKYVKKVAIKMDAKDVTFRGTFTVTKTIEVMDIFKWLPPYARKVAEKFFKRPVYFRFLGNLDGQLVTPEGTFNIKQKATSEMNFTQ
jgi:hypothetical protein